MTVSVTPHSTVVHREPEAADFQDSAGMAEDRTDMRDLTGIIRNSTLKAAIWMTY